MRRTKTAERELRLRLEDAVLRVVSALGNCPTAEISQCLDERSAEAAAAHVEEATSALQDAIECVQALERLDGASDEAALLCTSSRSALAFVSEVLTGVVAATGLYVASVRQQERANGA
jgi:hypothetical protein